MIRPGVNVDALRPPDARSVAASGAKWIRLPLRQGQDTRGIIDAYRAEGVKVLGVLDSDSIAGFGTPGVAIPIYAERCGAGLSALESWNEPDSGGATSSTLTQGELLPIMRLVRGQFRRVNPSLPILGAGLVSGQPDWWNGELNALVDGLCLHPYVQDEHSVSALLEGYRRWGKPIWITEFEWSPGLARALSAQPDVPVALVYCWRGWSGWQRALIDEQGNRTPIYGEFRQWCKEVDMATTDDLDKRLAVLERQQSMQTEVLRRVLAGQWKGGAESAVAELLALNPTLQGDWKEFPKVQG